jgi:hypothetical protein
MKRKGGFNVDQYHFNYLKSYGAKLNHYNFMNAKRVQKSISRYSKPSLTNNVFRFTSNLGAFYLI